MKFRKDTHLADWISANPEVYKWFKRAKAKNADSAKVMASYIYSYWNEHLSKRLSDIQAWVAEVKTQNKSDDLETKRTWGTELETWLPSKKLKKNSRRLTVVAVRNFFYDKVDLTNRKFTLASSENRILDNGGRTHDDCEHSHYANDNQPLLLYHRVDWRTDSGCSTLAED